MSAKSGTKTATFVKKAGWGTGDARIYRLDPPLVYEVWGEGDEKEERTTEFVAVSAAGAMFSGPETYIFPCDAEGKVLDWGELEGSYRGRFDHAEALQRAGYEVTDG